MKEMISMIVNANLLFTTLFLLFSAIFFACAAYKKRKKASDALGDIVSLYFMLSSICLIYWR